MEAKVCTGCSKEHPLSNFYKRRESRDGHRADCKNCVDAKNRKYVERNKEAITAYKKQYAEDNAEQIVQYRQKWYDDNKEDIKARVNQYSQTPRGQEVRKQASNSWLQRHPEKKKASQAVNNAIRDGRLVRQLCEVCGEKAQGHHEDYDKPLEVRWLCSTHHAELHRQRRRATA